MSASTPSKLEQIPFQNNWFNKLDFFLKKKKKTQTQYLLEFESVSKTLQLMNSASLRVLYCIVPFLLHSQNHKLKLTVIENSGFWASGKGERVAPS